jgi:S-(hydroxymethyl)glutathione dehydrogenase/alcohol dehydrogenase
VKVTAAVLDRPSAPQVVERLELDPPGPGEVLVQIAASGICRSDLSLLDGKWPVPTPIVLGHEGAGVIAAVGAGVPESRVGEHVVLTFAPACGACRFCLQGRANLCTSAAHAYDTGTLLDGTTRLHRGEERVHHLAVVSSFAEHAVVPATAAIAIDERLDLGLACLLGCGITTGVCSVTTRANVRPGDAVAIFGCGGVGLAAVQGARLVSATPIVAVDPLAGKRALALRLGATHAVAPTVEGLAEIRTLTGGGVDVAFEALGSPEVAEQAFSVVRDGGTTVLIGQPAIGVRAGFPVYDVTQFEHTILGTNLGGAVPALDIPRLARLAVEGLLDLESLVTDRFPLADIGAAVDRTRSGHAGRVILEMG